MKVSVFYRNVNAKKDFDDAKKIYDALHGKAKAAATKPKRNGFMSEELDATTVRDVQDAVANKLSGSPISNDPNFVLRAENIWVFQEDGGKLKRVPHGDDKVKIGTKHFALEVFEDTVPCDLFRTVALDQVYPPRCVFQLGASSPTFRL